LWGALRGLAKWKALEMATLSERGLELEKGMMLVREMEILVRWAQVFAWEMEKSLGLAWEMMKE
jgi:hypothetical protein